MDSFPPYFCVVKKLFQNLVSGLVLLIVLFGADRTHAFFGSEQYPQNILEEQQQVEVGGVFNTSTVVWQGYYSSPHPVTRVFESSKCKPVLLTVFSEAVQSVMVSCRIAVGEMIVPSVGIKTIVFPFHFFW